MAAAPPPQTQLLTARIADRFITDALRDQGAEVLRRARSIVWLTLPIVFVQLVGMGEMSARCAYTLLAGLLVTTTASLLCPLLLKRFESIPLVGTILLSAIVVNVTAMAWVAGGLGAPALYALIMVPLLATFCVSRSFGMVWGGICLAVVGVFGALYVGDMVPPTAVPPGALIRGHGLVLGLLIIVTLSGVRMYERLREQELVELELAQQRAEAANRAKDAFLANISHEIRTPMAGVMTASALLVDMQLDKNAIELAEMIHKSADALMVVVDDVLDFAKLQEGRIDLSAEPFDVMLTVQDVMHLMASDAEAKGITLRAHVPDRESAVVMGDEARVRQILINLVSNAIKFTDQGSVDIELACVPRDDQMSIVIDVVDTGMGMSPTDLKRVFERFERAVPSGVGPRRGAGLGLSISRHLTELMEGTLKATSVLGEGSRFMLRLSLASTTLAPRSRASLGHLAPLSAHVLLAEDNPVNRRVCALMLERLGCSVDLARDGQEAIDKAIDKPYDIILMDCFMPELDGMEATRRLRARGGVLASMPIVAFTASANQDNHRLCLEAGMNDVIPKPVQMPRLAKSLKRWLRKRSSSRPPGLRSLAKSAAHAREKRP